MAQPIPHVHEVLAATRPEAVRAEAERKGIHNIQSVFITAGVDRDVPTDLVNKHRGVK